MIKLLFNFKNILVALSLFSFFVISQSYAVEEIDLDERVERIRNIRQHPVQIQAAQALYQETKVYLERGNMNNEQAKQAYISCVAILMDHKINNRLAQMPQDWENLLNQMNQR